MASCPVPQIMALQASSHDATAMTRLFVAPIPVDQEGLQLPEAVDPPRIIFVTPSHQCPLGRSASLGACARWNKRAAFPLDRGRP